MQTFLPYSNFLDTMHALDYRRLGKQRVEAYQIYRALTEPDYGWQHHPAVRMWAGFEECLKVYHNTAIVVWIYRGYRNNMPLMEVDWQHVKMPWWLGDSEFHESHRSKLVQKKPEFYRPLFPNVTENLAYKWPVQ